METRLVVYCMLCVSSYSVLTPSFSSLGNAYLYLSHTHMNIPVGGSPYYTVTCLAILLISMYVSRLYSESMAST